jgi:hypothetical protein
MLITLIVFIYRNTLRFGIAVMLLHDVADPWMELAKLANYTRFKFLADAAFVTFALVFVYTRVYMFPRYIIYASYRFCGLMDYPFVKVTLGCFAGLWILHVYWSFLIFKVFEENIVKGTLRGDVRENVDD